MRMVGRSVLNVKKIPINELSFFKKFFLTYGWAILVVVVVLVVLFVMYVIDPEGGLEMITGVVR